jgi:hypothetical protein
VDQWIRLAQDLLRGVWRSHYHIPRPVYGAVTVIGFAVAASNLDWRLRIAGVFIAGVGAQGLLRWFLDSRPVAALAVARFGTEPGREGTAVRIQREIMTALQDHLWPDLPLGIVSIPAMVGRDQRGFAIRLRARLRALYLVYGDIRPRGQDESIYPRIVQPPEPYLMHLDWFTLDRTPQKTTLKAAFDKLTPARDVADVEYPYGFANELEALVRSLEGRLWLLVGEPNRAETVLLQALDIAGESKSHAVDQVRIALAEALANQAVMRRPLPY